MHDIRAIRENPAAFEAALSRRSLSGLSAEVLALDEDRRAKILAAIDRFTPGFGGDQELMERYSVGALLRAAESAMRNAYVPYSHFPVGAALRGASGAIYAAANVENAAYPEGQCAEASAIGAMVAAGVLVLGRVHPLLAIDQAMLDGLVGARASEVQTLFERLDDTHPDGPPHYYLSLLGTHPALAGMVTVGGFLYDVDSGRLTQLV